MIPQSLTPPPSTFAHGAWRACTADEPAEVELLDPEIYDVPQRLSDDDCLTHTGGEGRRRSRTELEQDDDQ